MAQNTPINALPWAELTDIPNAQTGFQNLANAIDTRLIPRFTDSTARSAAITSPTEGMLSYLTGTHRLDVYDNGAWTLLWQRAGSATLAKGSWTRTSTSTSSNSTDYIFSWEAAASYNTAGMWSLGTNPTRVTIPNTGIYRFRFRTVIASAASGARFGWFKLNGTSTVFGREDDGTSSSVAFTRRLETIRSMTAGDYFETVVWNSGAAMDSNLGGTTSAYGSPAQLSVEQLS